MKNLIVVLISLFFAFSASAEIIGYDLMFEPNQKTLSESQKKEINELAFMLKDGERLRIYPLTKDEAFHRLMYAKIANIQAEEIATYVQTIGFELLGIPKNFPSPHKGMSVSVNLRYHQDKEEIIEEVQPLAHGLKSHYPPKPSQFFVINPKKDTLIVGNEGTTLFFEAGSLLSSTDVEVELKEYYNLADYMKGGMPTVSNGQMIETGGSIYLDAKQLDTEKRVKINQEKGIKVDFTLGKDNPDMQIFIKDPNSKEEMNWILPPEKTATSSWEMRDVVYNADGSILSDTTFTSEEAWLEHLEKEKLEKEERLKREKIEREEQMRIAAIKQKNLVKMTSKLEVYNLGFINCDKFLNDEILSPLNLLADEKIIAEYYLIYQDVRGVMRGYLDDQQVAFGKVPSNRKAILIAVSFVGKQAYYYETTIVAGSKIKPTISLELVEESFINEKLAMLK